MGMNLDRSVRLSEKGFSVNVSRENIMKNIENSGKTNDLFWGFDSKLEKKSKARGKGSIKFKCN